jgi:hypothetical protein
MIEKCIKCGKEIEPTPYQIKKKYYKCKECINAYKREWLKNHPPEKKPKGYYKKYYKKEYYQKRYKKYYSLPENKLKASCRQITRNAVRWGKLIKKSCEVCGAIKSEAHHKDYYKPLDVVWLCREHHTELHNKEKQII